MLCVWYCGHSIVGEAVGDLISMLGVDEIVRKEGSSGDVGGPDFVRVSPLGGKGNAASTQALPPIEAVDTNLPMTA